MKRVLVFLFLNIFCFICINRCAEALDINEILNDMRFGKDDFTKLFHDLSSLFTLDKDIFQEKVDKALKTLTNTGEEKKLMNIVKLVLHPDKFYSFNIDANEEEKKIIEEKRTNYTKKFNEEILPALWKYIETNFKDKLSKLVEEYEKKKGKKINFDNVNQYDQFFYNFFSCTFKENFYSVPNGFFDFFRAEWISNKKKLIINENFFCSEPYRNEYSSTLMEFFYSNQKDKSVSDFKYLFSISKFKDKIDYYDAINIILKQLIEKILIYYKQRNIHENCSIYCQENIIVNKKNIKNNFISNVSCILNTVASGQDVFEDILVFLYGKNRYEELKKKITRQICTIVIKNVNLNRLVSILVLFILQMT